MKALVLATVLPVAGTVAFWGLIALTVTAMNTKVSARTKTGAGNALLVLLPLSIAVMAVGMTSRQFLLNGAIFLTMLILLLIGAIRKRKTVSKLVTTLVALGIIAGVITGVVNVVFDGGMWLPTERITLKGGTVATGYVLSSDDAWTRYMDRDTDQIHIVPTNALVCREPL